MTARSVAVHQWRIGLEVDPRDLDACFGEFWTIVEALVPSPCPARND
jgi:hypothetical protein